MRASPLLLLLACTGEAPPAPAPAPPAPDDPVSRCVADRCGTAADPAACQADKCAVREEFWTLDPVMVRYDGNQITVSAKVGHAPRKVGDEVIPRDREAYVGLTAIREDGAEVDLAIHTLFPGRFEDEPLFLSEVGPGVRDIVFGLWDRKIEPCDDARAGCQKYGFLLDGSLAAWPPRTYVDGQRQRILPAELTLVVEWAGRARGALGGDVAQVRAALDKFAAPFGAAITSTLRVADERADDVVLRFRDDHDAVLAWQLAAPIGAVPRLDPTLDVDLRLTLGGDADERAWACARACTLEGEQGITCLASCL